MDPMTANKMLQSEKPLSPEPAIALPRKPPRNAPTIPMRIVTMIPPGSRPGMIALAIAPAISPNTIHARMDICENLLWVHEQAHRRFATAIPVGLDRHEKLRIGCGAGRGRI